MKTTNTLIDDIYDLVKFKSPDKSVDAEQIIDDFGEACKDLIVVSSMHVSYACPTSARMIVTFGTTTIV
jgi:hypothetical protein